MSEAVAPDSVEKKQAPYFEGERVYLEAHYFGGPDSDNLFYVKPLGKDNVFSAPLSSIIPVGHAVVETRSSKHAEIVEKVRTEWERLLYTSAVARYVQQVAEHEGLSDNVKMRLMSLELFKQLKETQGTYLELLTHAPVNFRRPGFPSSFPEISPSYAGPFRVEKSVPHFHLFDSNGSFYAQFNERGIADKVCEILNFILGIKTVRDLRT